jgi:CheY-like chemotaxis protein
MPGGSFGVSPTPEPVFFTPSIPEIHLIDLRQPLRNALKVASMRPDLVLMNLEMPGMSGLEAMRRLKTEPDAPRVIIMTLHEENRSLGRAGGGDG